MFTLNIENELGTNAADYNFGCLHFLFTIGLSQPNGPWDLYILQIPSSLIISLLSYIKLSTYPVEILFSCSCVLSLRSFHGFVVSHSSSLSGHNLSNFIFNLGCIERRLIPLCRETTRCSNFTRRCFHCRLLSSRQQLILLCHLVQRATHQTPTKIEP